MKKLQNNFTTPEQSKRLLELGVPADSADCYYDKYRILPELLFNGDTFQDLLDAYEPEDRDEFLPCWSVGRLIEIMQICKLNSCGWDLFYQKFHLINKLMDIIETYNSRLFDFSKLEE